MSAQSSTLGEFHGKDLTGLVFGRLTVAGLENKICGSDGTTEAIWLCKCSCGNTKSIRGRNLKSGNSTSCGCAHSEQMSERFWKHGYTNRGDWSSTYRCWVQIKQRCFNKNSPDYPDYGGRGIVVCERWMKSFIFFLEDMGECPENMSIERIKNSGNYEPSNCKWDTQRNQNRNKRSNRIITFRGETKVLTDWALEIGMNTQTLFSRLNELKWSVEKSLTTPVNHNLGNQS